MSGIGAMRERVTLLRPVRTPDGGGGHEIAFEARDTVWAAAEDRPSAPGSVRTKPVRRRRFTFRPDVEVLFETRLGHDGETFRVTGIREDRGPDPLLRVDAEAVR